MHRSGRRRRFDNRDAFKRHYIAYQSWRATVEDNVWSDRNLAQDTRNRARQHHQQVLCRLFNKTLPIRKHYDFGYGDLNWRK